MLNIALIDDDNNDRFLFKKSLKRLQVEVDSFVSCRDFKDNSELSRYDYVFIDYTIKNSEGTEEIISFLETTRPQLHIVLISHERIHITDDHRTNPMISGMLLKSNTPRIQNWVESRIYERANPQESYS